MSSLCFYVSSITNAMRGKEILERNNIRSFINRSLESFENGCGYCIIVSSNHEQAEKIIRSAGIRIRGKKQTNDAP